MANETVVSQKIVEITPRLSTLITRVRPIGASTVVQLPALANTGSGTIPGAKGTNRTTAVSIAVLVDHDQPQSEVKNETSGTSTTPTLAVTGLNSNRDTQVTITTGGATALATGDEVVLVSLHRNEDLAVVDQKFQ